MPKKDPKIVLIGGGTGSFAVLSSLKNYTKNISALVNMVDDGGSTGQLRDEYGVLPPGDIRQCLVALSQAPQAVRDLFNFRFPGDRALAGHSFGNLFLSATEMITDNFIEAVKVASEVLNITGKVYPVTIEKCRLGMEVNGKQIIGEREIETSEIGEKSKPKLFLQPKAKVNPEALIAVLEADLVVIAPGNLYASIIPALLVEGLSEGLRETKAPILYVCNLLNKANHTANFEVDDYVSELERFIGADVINTVFYNIDLPNDDLLAKYALEGEYPVIVDEQKLSEASYKTVAGKFLSRKAHSLASNDIFIKRSLIRHDGEAISKAIIASLDS